MSKRDLDEFDGYRKWLGISEKRRPPTHYALLGITLDEDDADVIRSAAEQRRVFIKTKRGEGYDDLVDEILYLLKEAEFTLLKPDMRRDYDSRMNLVKKRRRRRGFFFTRGKAKSSPASRRGGTVGEETGFVEEYAKIIAILCIAFFGMAAASFLLPWHKLLKSNDPKPQVQNDGRPIVRPPVAPIPPPVNPKPANPVAPAANQKPVAEASKTKIASEITADGGKTIMNSIGMKLVLIPAGEFMMGSSDADLAKVAQLDALFEKSRYLDEQPWHSVRITMPFYLGRTEVTQGEWKAVMGTEPWQRQKFVQTGSDYPATFVNWNDAVEFCRRLSGKEGHEYRLPTEAEWEYACRAGTKTLYSFGDDAGELSNYAWCIEITRDGNAKGEQYAHRVGQKKPNPFGLFDLHGNVFEWCRDVYDEKAYGSRSGTTDDPFVNAGPDRRVLRGGSWDNVPRYTRSADRFGYAPVIRVNDIGFRVSRTK
ncbi:MAG: formylglycine-generating enzyme family protein [Planctomycetaceae bacterium]